jgi:hypothetical protein
MLSNVHIAHLSIHYASVAAMARCTLADFLKSVFFNDGDKFPELAFQAGQGTSKLP